MTNPEPSSKAESEVYDRFTQPYSYDGPRRIDNEHIWLALIGLDLAPFLWSIITGFRQ